MSAEAAQAQETRIPPQKYLIVFVAALIGFGPASVDMYLPSFLAIAADLGTSYDNVQLTLSFFLVGFAAGQLVLGPLSDRLGRKAVLLGGIALYCLSSLLCAITTGITGLIAFRFLQALGGSTGQVIARAILRDVYSGSALARAMSLMMLVAAAAPLVAPLLGSYLLEWASWRAIFLVLTGFGFLCLLASLFYFRETHTPERRAELNFMRTLGAFVTISRDRHALGYLLAGGFAFAMMFAYISGAPGIFIDYYGLSPRAFSLIFACNVAGLAAGNIINSRLVGRFGSDRLLGVGTGACLTASMALAVLAWSGDVSVAVFAVVLFLAVSPVHTVFANSMAGLLEHYPNLAGTASALFGAAQFGFGAVAGALVGQFYAGGPRSMVTVMTVVAVLAYLAQRFMARR